MVTPVLPMELVVGIGLRTSYEADKSEVIYRTFHGLSGIFHCAPLKTARLTLQSLRFMSKV